MIRLKVDASEDGKVAIKEAVTMGRDWTLLEDSLINRLNGTVMDIREYVSELHLMTSSEVEFMVVHV